MESQEEKRVWDRKNIWRNNDQEFSKSHERHKQVQSSEGKKKIKSYHKGSQREKKADYVQRNKYKNYNRILTCMVADKKNSLKCWKKKEKNSTVHKSIPSKYIFLNWRVCSQTKTAKRTHCEQLSSKKKRYRNFFMQKEYNTRLKHGSKQKKPEC